MPEHLMILRIRFGNARDGFLRDDENGFRLVFNNGHDAGETVPHLHLHILGGREMTWPPG
jgi:diadenosine tetraphosphate (Ap4A) HIT family hydrolase